MLVFRTVFPKRWSIQRKQSYLPECPRKNNRHVSSTPHDQAWEMSHFFYYFKLNLVFCWSHPAGVVGNSVSGLWGTPTPSWFLWASTQGAQAGPSGLWSMGGLLMCLFARSSLSPKAGGSPAELCCGCNFSLRPRGLSERWPVPFGLTNVKQANRKEP